jgi:hypothetical protein
LHFERRQSKMQVKARNEANMGAWRLLILLTVGAVFCASNLADFSHVTPGEGGRITAPSENPDCGWAMHRDDGHRDETPSFRLAAALPMDDGTVVLPWRAEAFALQFSPLNSQPASSLQMQQVRFQI